MPLDFVFSNAAQPGPGLDPEHWSFSPVLPAFANYTPDSEHWLPGSQCPASIRSTIGSHQSYPLP